VLANEAFALLNDDTDAPGRGFAPLFTWAAFSRADWSFCAARLSPPTFTPPVLGMKSLILKFSHVSAFALVFLVVIPAGKSASSPPGH
jgi:hypothetical protein